MQIPYFNQGTVTFGYVAKVISSDLNFVNGWCWVGVLFYLLCVLYQRLSV
mgnify:CR=1 FL=1